MKKICSVLLLACLMLTLLPTAMAASTYVIQSSEPQGYLYLYDKASSTYGNNLGAYYNNTTVQVINWYGGNEFALVRTPDGRKGYMNHNYLYTQEEIDARPVFTVNSLEPAGYCYMYDRDSSTYGKNLGRYNDGEKMQIIGYNTKHTWAYVYSVTTGKIGWIVLKSLTETETRPIEGTCYVDSIDPMGYCYMYDKPSSTNGKNLGRFNDFDSFDIIDWNADRNYALVRSHKNNKIGYVRKGCLVKN